MCGIIYNKIYFPSFENFMKMSVNLRTVFIIIIVHRFPFYAFVYFSHLTVHVRTYPKKAAQNYCSSLFVVVVVAVAGFAVCLSNFLFIFILFHFCCMLHWIARISLVISFTIH